MEYTISQERLTAAEYIDFLKTTNLGSQYPKERFEKRIETLVSSVGISLVARNVEGAVVGVLFAITDFAYWMFVTDLGVSREWEGRGIGTALMKTAHEIAGGEKDVAIYLELILKNKLFLTEKKRIHLQCRRPGFDIKLPIFENKLFFFYIELYNSLYI